MSAGDVIYTLTYPPTQPHCHEYLVKQRQGVSVVVSREEAKHSKQVAKEFEILHDPARHVRLGSSQARMRMTEP